MRKIISLVFVIALSAIFASSVNAQASTDFENFTVGSPNGQFGWSSTGPYDHKISDNSLYPNAPSAFGTRSLRISNAVTSGSFGDQTFSDSAANEAGETTATNGGMSGGTRQNFYQFSIAFTSATGSYQAGQSVVLSPDRGDGARMSWVQIMDTPTGLQVNFNEYKDGDFVQTTVANNLSRTSVHTLKVTMQFVEGPANDVVKVYVDGSLSYTGTSWEDYFRDWEDGTTRTVDSVLFRTGGAAAPATLNGGILFDNLNMSTGSVATTSAQCKNGGWMTLVNSDGMPFKNQGQCVSSTVGNGN